MPDLAGNTPLHYCAYYLDYDNPALFKMTEKLLKAGADPNSTNRYGYTPLQHIMVRDDLFQGKHLYKLPNMIQLLVKYNADPFYEKSRNEGMPKVVVDRILYFNRMYPEINLLFIKFCHEEEEDKEECEYCKVMFCIL